MDLSYLSRFLLRSHRYICSTSLGVAALSQHELADVLDGRWDLIRAPVSKLCLPRGTPHYYVLQDRINLCSRLTAGPGKQRVHVIGLLGPSEFGELEALRDQANRLTWGLYRAVRERARRK